MRSHTEVSAWLDVLTITSPYGGPKRVVTPWGVMREVTFGELLVKIIQVDPRQRTSLQYHREKDELIVPLEGDGFVEVGDPAGVYTVADGPIRIRPNVAHRVTGPLLYLELETNDRGRDTVRLVDDYGRATE